MPEVSEVSSQNEQMNRNPSALLQGKLAMVEQARLSLLPF